MRDKRSVRLRKGVGLCVLTRCGERQGGWSGNKTQHEAQERSGAVRPHALARKRWGVQQQGAVLCKGLLGTMAALGPTCRSPSHPTSHLPPHPKPAARWWWQCGVRHLQRTQTSMHNTLPPSQAPTCSTLVVARALCVTSRGTMVSGTPASNTMRAASGSVCGGQGNCITG